MTVPVQEEQILEIRRLELNAKLKATLGSGNVYFQPADNVTIKYPAIVYERDDAVTKHSNNQPYTYTQRYQVTYIDSLPNSGVVAKLALYPLSAFSRHFATSGLNHDVFVIYH